MSEEELNALARLILDTATIEEDEEEGVITVDPDLLFRYYVLRKIT
jgi:hypothetical protein